MGDEQHDPDHDFSPLAELVGWARQTPQSGDHEQHAADIGRKRRHRAARRAEDEGGGEQPQGNLFDPRATLGAAACLNRWTARPTR